MELQAFVETPLRPGAQDMASLTSSFRRRRSAAADIPSIKNYGIEKTPVGEPDKPPGCGFSNPPSEGGNSDVIGMGDDQKSQSRYKSSSVFRHSSESTSF